MFTKKDDALIALAVKGDKNAWLKLIKRYESVMYNYALRMTGNPDDGKDLMQEIFISVYRNLSTFRNEGSFKSWIFRIAHFRCIEFYRRKKPNQSLDDCEEFESNERGPEQDFVSNQSNNRLVNAMQTLPMNQKAVVELKFFGQFTFDEIAEQLAISSNTAKSRLYSALNSLKIVMEEEHA